MRPPDPASRRLIIGTGYLGSRLLSRWLGEGQTAFATSRKPQRRQQFQSIGATAIDYDVIDGGQALPAADVVVYAVGFDRSLGLSQRKIAVEGIERTLDRLPPPRRFIYISSTGVYGDHQGDWVDETTPPSPIDLGGQAVLAGEEALWRKAAGMPTTFVVLRFAGIYGPGRMIGADRLRRGEAIAGRPDAWLNLVHVEDGVELIERAIKKDSLSGTCVVSDGHPVQRVDFYKEAARLLGAAEPTFDGAAASRHRGDRRIRNDRMRHELAPDLQFPDYRTGLRDCLRAVE